jgi:hypothetical protein
MKQYAKLFEEFINERYDMFDTSKMTAKELKDASINFYEEVKDIPKVKQSDVLDYLKSCKTKKYNAGEDGYASVYDFKKWMKFTS